LLLLFVTIPALAINPRKPQKKVNQYKGYTLVWHDEFKGEGRPSELWDYEQGFVRNNELQWYQSDNATVKDGCLVIEGRKERVKNPLYREGARDWRRSREYAEYTSSSLTTRKSFTFKYGRVEVRAKIPTARGSWPAIWFLGNRGGWPENGEIDLMEYYIRDGAPSILANACWGGKRLGNPVWDSAVIPYSHFLEKDPEWGDKFHLWRMDWDEDFIRLYLDGELLNEIDLSRSVNGGARGNTDNPFSNEIEGFEDYILLNLALGAQGGEPDDSKFPLYYYIDYVRVYQAK